mmetsp:Transcript_11653/g.32752  ORF Transcript_11653/g.32752 Transcript_11653/m.32752 type:complete len:203 (+) Transcript_11653:4177-4785(+)
MGTNGSDAKSPEPAWGEGGASKYGEKDEDDPGVLENVVTCLLSGFHVENNKVTAGTQDSDHGNNELGAFSQIESHALPRCDAHVYHEVGSHAVGLLPHLLVGEGTVLVLERHPPGERLAILCQLVRHGQRWVLPRLRAGELPEELRAYHLQLPDGGLRGPVRGTLERQDERVQQVTDAAGAEQGAVVLTPHQELRPVRRPGN